MFGPRIGPSAEQATKRSARPGPVRIVQLPPVTSRVPWFRTLATIAALLIGGLIAFRNLAPLSRADRDTCDLVTMLLLVYPLFLMLAQHRAWQTQRDHRRFVAAHPDYQPCTIAAALIRQLPRTADLEPQAVRKALATEKIATNEPLLVIRGHLPAIDNGLDRRFTPMVRQRVSGYWLEIVVVLLVLIGIPALIHALRLEPSVTWRRDAVETIAKLLGASVYLLGLCILFRAVSRAYIRIAPGVIQIVGRYIWWPRTAVTTLSVAPGMVVTACSLWSSYWMFRIEQAGRYWRTDLHVRRDRELLKAILQALLAPHATPPLNEEEFVT